MSKYAKKAKELNSNIIEFKTEIVEKYSLYQPLPSFRMVAYERHFDNFFEGKGKTKQEAWYNLKQEILKNANR